MSLDVGSRLGHYDVTALIGEGGMVRSVVPELTPDERRMSGWQWWMVACAPGVVSY